MITTFFLDLWNDLREKRLWPVAVGAVAATLAIPVLLLKPASDGGTPVPGPTASAAPSGVRLPALSLDVNAADKGSKLDTFNGRNPFKPMKDLTAATAAGTPTPTPTSSSPTNSAKSASAGSGSGSGGSGSPSSASTPSGSGTSGSGSTSGSHLVSQHTTTWIYTATFKFGTPGHMKTVKDAKPFTMLPDETTPTLIFASAGADGKSAIFYIQDPTFQAAGEGKCNAPGDKCRFVTLKADASHDEETFISNDGVSEYDVQLLSIGRKTIADSNSGSKSTSSPKGKQAAGARKKQAKPSSLDFLPVLLGFSSTTQRSAPGKK